MTDQHPITPPPELVEQWRDAALALFDDIEYPDPFNVDDARDEHIATQAARWGADQELEACCDWLREAKNHGFGYAEHGAELARRLRARRPKPPSLKEQAFVALSNSVEWREFPKEYEIISRALELLDD